MTPDSAAKSGIGFSPLDCYDFHFALQGSLFVAFFVA